MSILSRGQWISLGITGLGAFIWLSSWYFKTQGELEAATPAQQAVGQWADEYGSRVGGGIAVGGLFCLTIASFVHAAMQLPGNDYHPA